MDSVLTLDSFSGIMCRQSTKMDAFSVFIQHWMKEENEMKAQQWREMLRLRQNVACESILLNRRIIYAFKIIIATMMDMIAEGDNDNEEFDELFEIANRLAVDVVVNEVVYGVCDHCESGLVKFRVEENCNDMAAVCRNCEEVHMHLHNIFPDN